MKCPHCTNKIGFVPPVLANIYTYGGTRRAKTTCCGKIVNVEPIQSYEVSIPYNFQNIEDDDWGNKQNTNS